MTGRNDATVAWFQRLTARPRLMLCASIAVIVVLASGLTSLVKDTSVDAFIPPDHPALVADAEPRAPTESIALSPTQLSLFAIGLVGVAALAFYLASSL